MIRPNAEKSAVTILMAEDDPDDRIAMKGAFGEVLRDEFQLHFVENGEELIDYLSRRPKPAEGSSSLPHLILLDLNMPRKDGRETLREIKAIPALRHIPVVIWTTSTAQHDINFCYESGASSYVVKPSGYSQLVDTLGTLCKYWFQQVSLPQKRT
jgi:CheY-like chemotaxis protein